LIQADTLPTTCTPARYFDYLRRTEGAKANKAKGDRTRSALMLAAVKTLEKKGYRDLRVADIASAAKVSSATFYVYFEDKTDITLRVLSDFLEQPLRFVRPTGAAKTPFAGILEANRQWLELVRANAGLVRSLFQLSDEDPGFANLVHEANRRWYARVAENAQRTLDGAIDRRVALLCAYSLGSMIDEICRKLVVQTDPHFVELMQDTVPSDQDLAELLSLLWYRALFGRDPADTMRSGAALSLYHSHAG
jgi:TetR/AcrR family transcriptional regulator, transcriptional repressor for nem operon